PCTAIRRKPSWTSRCSKDSAKSPSPPAAERNPRSCSLGRRCARRSCTSLSRSESAFGPGSRGVESGEWCFRCSSELWGWLAARRRRLFGTRAPLVDALVIARRAELDAELRERYTRSGLAHLLSISGLHVGFFAAWLSVLLKRLRLGPRPRFVAGTAVMLAY